MNKIVLILIGIVLLSIAGFATLWFQVGGELQDRADAVLVACRDGKSRSIYDAASPAFRAGWSFAQFMNI